MPRDNVIVAKIDGIDPSVDKPSADMVGEAPEGFSIRFEGDRVALLPAGENAAGFSRSSSLYARSRPRSTSSSRPRPTGSSACWCP